MLLVLPSSDGDVSVNISDFWSDQHGVAIRGWVSAAAGPPGDLEFEIDGTIVPVSCWHPRDDILTKAPAGFRGCAWGFWCYLPVPSTPSVTIQRHASGKTDRQKVQLKRSVPKLPPGYDQAAPGLFEQFRAEVNRHGARVLEIGSRQVVRGGMSKRSQFPECDYVGFDYYSDDNTDVVGDAHELSKFFGCEFDAVFSLAVLEHLAMPWMVAAEINKVLKPRGLTYHATHFAFPLHEQPWDFWRYTAEGLKVLFAPPLGYELIGCAYDTPARLHPDDRSPELMHLPFEPAWIGIGILARKNAELDTDKFGWQATLSSTLGNDSRYPPPASGQAVAFRSAATSC